MKLTLMSILSILGSFIPRMYNGSLEHYAAMQASEKYNTYCTPLTHYDNGNTVDIVVVDTEGVYFVISVNKDDRTYISDNRTDNVMRVERQNKVQDVFNYYGCDAIVLTIYDGVQYTHYVQISQDTVDNMDEVVCHLIESELRKSNGYKNNMYVFRIVNEMTMDYVVQIRDRYCQSDNDLYIFIDRVKDFTAETTMFQTNTEKLIDIINSLREEIK